MKMERSRLFSVSNRCKSSATLAALRAFTELNHSLPDNVPQFLYDWKSRPDQMSNLNFITIIILKFILSTRLSKKADDTHTSAVVMERPRIAQMTDHFGKHKYSRTDFMNKIKRNLRNNFDESENNNINI